MTARAQAPARTTRFSAASVRSRVGGPEPILPATSRRALLAATLALAAACSRGDEADAKRRVFSQGGEAAAGRQAFDFAHPAAALALGAEEVARRLGSFEWTAVVEWTVERTGDEARRVRVVERHKVRQSATGDFEVQADLDPGTGPGSESGKQVVHAGGLTYARAKHAPFRERPTDRGRDARRYRDESFEVGAAVARLYGEVLSLTPAGEATALGRPAKRYKLGLAAGAGPPAPAPRPAGLPAPDDDSARRFRFLEGRVPAAAEGELLLDAASGAPLRLRLAGAFTVKDQPAVRATFELLAQVRALGGEVAAVVAPKGALPDERKPAGVAAALEAAGLRKRGEEGKAARDEDDDQAD